ncbi:hypothetical protein [Bacillus massilinigeriensis]|uniref:hypothetical protein n=1 Tax=Bacillus mediterraneensis TaxID=1805474 RepID=UPI0009F6507E|nr:hypothetical protein [Bacillus mediterraneensis]
MKKMLTNTIILFLVLISLCLQFLALMHLFPIYLSSPILFLSLLLLFSHLNGRQRFKGFKNGS